MNVTYADLSCGIDRIYIYFSFDYVLFTHTLVYTVQLYYSSVLTLIYASLVHAHNLLVIVFVRSHHHLWKVLF